MTIHRMSVVPHGRDKGPTSPWVPSGPPKSTKKVIKTPKNDISKCARGFDFLTAKNGFYEVQETQIYPQVERAKPEIELYCSIIRVVPPEGSVKKRRLIFFWLMAYGGLRLIVFWLTAKSLNSAKSRKRDRSGEIRLIYWKSVFLAIFQWISAVFDPFFRKNRIFSTIFQRTWTGWTQKN